MRSEGWEGADAERAFMGGGGRPRCRHSLFLFNAGSHSDGGGGDEGGRVFASDDAAATVTSARTVADGGIEGLPPRRVSPNDASSMLEKGNHNKNGTKDIGIQA